MDKKNVETITVGICVVIVALALLIMIVKMEQLSIEKIKAMDCQSIIKPTQEQQ
jgi:hypothetical protein